MNKMYLALPLTGLFFNLSAAKAEISCGTPPTCAELGYSQTLAECTGRKTIKCPFDQSKLFCADPQPQVYQPKVGDVKYSLYASKHDGWLLCDGTQYSQTTYPKLYSVISTNFCHRYTSRFDTAYTTNNCKSDYFAVPDYRGFFLRSVANYNTLSNTVNYPNVSGNQSASYYSDALYYKGGNYNGSVYIPRYEELPNITGSLSDVNAGSTTGVGGAFYSTSGTYKPNGVNAQPGGFGFQASRSNPIYNGSNVIPANYGVYTFIYAGE